MVNSPLTAWIGAFASPEMLLSTFLHSGQWYSDSSERASGVTPGGLLCPHSPGLPSVKASVAPRDPLRGSAC